MSDDIAPDYLTSLQHRLGDFLTPSVRLGVTGLARSGKTVFITALVRNLVSGGRLPFFIPEAEGRIVRAYLEPQPTDALPRFAYEAHLADLLAAQPRWPDSTRRISELRVTIEYRSTSALKRAVGLSKLHLDIVDYPGEWVVDLALLDKDFTSFSRDALALARAPDRQAAAKPWLDWLASLRGDEPDDERLAMTGAQLFTAYLAAVREDGAMAALSPGRFLLPGDLEGSPLVTFCPLDPAAGPSPARASLAAMMARRFESYKSEVVGPFFEQHFSRLNRQIVLVDVLGALDQGSDAINDLERAVSDVLAPFHQGEYSWLSFLFGSSIDRVAFAATKADHLPAASHDRLAAILRRIVDRRLGAAEAEGAEVTTLALAALRATRETRVVDQGTTLPCLTGMPLKGEQLGAQIFDGKTEAAIFPGDLPADPDAALDAARHSASGSLSLVRFQPPRLSAADDATSGATIAFPHIRLDKALNFLIADYLT